MVGRFSLLFNGHKNSCKNLQKQARKRPTCVPRGIYSGQPEKFSPPPLGNSSLFLWIFCGNLSFIKVF